MTIIHRPSRVYANADGLSRVQGNVGQEVVEEDKALTTDTEAVKRVWNDGEHTYNLLINSECKYKYTKCK